VITNLGKMVMEAAKGGQLNRNLERRIDAIQAIAILILNAKTDEFDRLLGSESKGDDSTTKPRATGVAGRRQQPGRRHRDGRTDIP
jgi:DNA-binding response OmpR family regulator